DGVAPDDFSTCEVFPGWECESEPESAFAGRGYLRNRARDERVLDLADHLCWAMFGGHRAHGSGGLLNHRLPSHGSQAIASGATGWADCGEAQGHRAAGEFSLV